MSTIQKRPAITLIILTLIFILPMVAAWFTYTRGTFLPQRGVNHGILLQPPIPIATLSLTNTQGQVESQPLPGKWTLIYLASTLNETFVAHRLYDMRQIRQATGKNRERVERAIITQGSSKQFDAWLKACFPGTQHFIISTVKKRQFELNMPKNLDLAQGSLYLVDPLGNIMLSYAPNTVPKGILKDLERALKVSQIG